MLHTSLYAQPDSTRVAAIDEQVYAIEAAAEPIDTIAVKHSAGRALMAISKNKWSTAKPIKVKGCLLTITCYQQNGVLLLIDIKEQNRHMDDLFKQTILYYFERKRIDTKTRFSVRICTGFDLKNDQSGQFEYSKQLTDQFLEQYVLGFDQKLRAQIKPFVPANSK